MLGAPSKIWFLPQDFMQSQLGDKFVGYEASARLSELASKYPEMIESRRNGKYIARRLKVENFYVFSRTIPDELAQIFDKYNVTGSTQSRLL